MTDIPFDNLFDYQPLSYHDENIYLGFDQWPGAAFPESHAAAPIYANCLDDIEHMYIGLHKCVDHMVAKLSVRTPPRLDQIREQNRKLIDKLTTLESAITGDNATVTSGSGSPLGPSASAPRMDRVRNAGKRRRASQSAIPASTSASMPITPRVSPPRYQNYVDIA